MRQQIAAFFVWTLISHAALATQVQDLELPAAAGEKVLRRAGFSFVYDFSHKNPKWVAYYLNKEKVKTATLKRLSRFSPDTEVDPKITHDTYTHAGDYDRGHMAPAEDMAWSEASRRDCFKMSNITPQLEDLNQKLWRDLETSIRNRAFADGEIYTATGPILRDGLKKLVKNEKSGPVTTDVSVPEKFFKVLYQGRNGRPRAIGFVIPQDWKSKDFCSYAVSIDQIEADTGLDFFPRLADSVERKVEASTDCASWKLSTKREKGK